MSPCLRGERRPRRLSFKLFADVLVTVAVLAVLGAAGLAIAPRLLDFQTYIVRTPSMAPAIPAGSVVFVQPVKPLQLKVGDVITFRRPEAPAAPITHRIVSLKIQESGVDAAPLIRTKGDANNTVDPWQIEMRGVAWRVAFAVPFLGYAYDFAQGPYGRLAFLIIPAVFLLPYLLDRIWRLATHR